MQWLVFIWALFVLGVYIGGFFLPASVGARTIQSGIVYAVFLLIGVAASALRRFSRGSDPEETAPTQGKR